MRASAYRESFCDTKVAVKKDGRPRSYPDGPPMANYQVRLPLHLVRKARRVGEGNMAEGIRRLLRYFDEREMPRILEMLDIDEWR